MTRIGLAFGLALLGIGCVVALVRAQDAAPATIAPGAFPWAEAEASGSLLFNGPSSAVAPTGFLADEAYDAADEAPAARPNAAERLKQLKNATSRSTPGVEPSRPALPIQTATNNPGEEAASGLGTVSVLKRPEPPAGSDRTTARRLQRPGSRPGTFTPDAPSTAPQALERPAPASSSSEAILSSVGPAIRVETTGPSSLVVGKEATYAVTIMNTGTTSVADLHLRVALPISARVLAEGASPDPANAESGVQKLIWTIPSVPPQASERVLLKVTPTENRPLDLMVDWAIRPVSATAQIEVKQPQLEVSVFGPRELMYGETAVYTIRLTNPGNGDAEEVAVAFGYGDQQLDPRPIGMVAAGQQMELKVELSPRQAGQIQVAAAATAAGGLKANANQDVVVRRAKLEVEVAGEPVKFAGSSGTYRVVVKNSGDAPATDVSLAVTIPQGSQLIPGGERFKATATGLIVDIGALAPKSERAVEIPCLLSLAGDNRLAAQATAALDLEASGAFVTRVEALADLKLTINDPSGPVAAGTEAVYELHIVNRGTKAATKVNVVAQFSPGIEPTSATGSPAEIVPGQVLFQSIPRIEPGQEIVLVVKAKADSAGNKRFRAEVTSDESDTQLVAQETTYFYAVR